MKAMILAAGVGSRLGEITKNTPKCLIEVGGITMLERIVMRLKDVGVSGVAINVHHHAEQVISFIKAHNDFGLEIVISREETLLDTGGGLKRVSSFFQSERSFLIHNADIYSTIDLRQLINRHNQRNAIATLAVMDRLGDAAKSQTATGRGLYFDQEWRLVGWTGQQDTPAPNSKPLGFCGVSVASCELFNFMEAQESFSLIAPFISAARASNRVWGELITQSEWVDIGTPQKLEALRGKLQGSF